LDNLEQRGKLLYVPYNELPPHTTLIPTTTLLRIKTDANGKPHSRKARCNIRGDRQQPHIHYDPHALTSPVAEKETIRTILALAATNNYAAHHWDLDAAFLHELLPNDNPIFIQQPKSFDGTYKHPHHVCKVVGNMYGTKQECRTFTQGLATFLTLAHYNRIASDACTYLYRDQHNPKHFILFAITIDDFLVVTNHTPLISTALTALKKKYSVKDLGPVQHIIGWKITRTPTDITITQSAYIDQILSRYQQTDCNPAPTPYLPEPLTRTHPGDTPLNPKLHNYNGIIGSLRYLADSTRPDIAHATSALATFITNPANKHWQAALRVLKYLKGTKNVGLRYTQKNEPQLATFTDSDFANCPETRRSVSGCVIMYNNSPVAWTSRKQSVVAGSTWEAEYIAAYHAARHTKCLRNLLTELGHQPQQATPLHMDNAAAMKTATTPHPTPKSKHIDVKFHHLKQQVNDNIVSPIHVPTANNAADILTKALRPAQYQLKVQLLRLVTATPEQGVRGL